MPDDKADKQDDLADALSKLAGGEIAPSEQEPPAPLEPPDAVPPRTTNPAPLTPQILQPARQATGRAARSSAAPARPTAPAPRPQRPSAPASRPAAPSPMPKVTQLPSTASPRMEDTGLSSVEPFESAAEEQQRVVLDDDDSVIMPASDATDFVQHPRRSARRPGGSSTRSAVYQTVEFRRSIIPILLTCGVLTIIFGTLKFALGPDSPLADLPVWLPIALFITGALLLALAVFNMLSVRQSLLDIHR